MQQPGEKRSKVAGQCSNVTVGCSVLDGAEPSPRNSQPACPDIIRRTACIIVGSWSRRWTWGEVMRSSGFFFDLKRSESTASSLVMVPPAKANWTEMDGSRVSTSCHQLEGMK